MHRQRRFRARQVAANDDDDPEAGAAPTIQQPARDTARQQGRSRTDIVKKAGLLSFEDDEEGAPDVPAPPRSVRAQPAPVLREEAGTHTQRSAAGEYSSEKLAQLRQQTRSLPAAAQPPKPANAGGFTLSGSFKVARQRAEDRDEIGAREMLKLAEPRLAPLLPPPPRNAKHLAPAVPAPAVATNGSSRLPPAEQDGDDANGFSIPTADAIRLAKEKRERLRSAHLAPDYVPLGGAAGLTSNQNAAVRLRGDKTDVAVLATGGDSDEERDAEADMRMQFVGRSGTGQAARASVFAAADAEGGDEDDEDEDDAWVRQQLQKAGAASLSTAPQQASTGGGSARDLDMARIPANATAADPVAQALAAGQSVMISLREGLRRQQEQQHHVDRQQVQTKARLADSLQAVTQLEGDVAAAAQKYTYLQEMRAFVADMCDMLQAKSPIIEVLEERLMKAAEDRGSAAAAAADARDTDELEAAQAAIGAAIGALSSGRPMSEAQQAAEAAAMAADAASVQNMPEVLDEFGRDMNVEKRRQAEERLAKRRSLAAQPAGDASEEDEAEVSSYNRERGQILEVAATLFTDVSEDYSTVEAVKRRLEDWQISYPAAYRDAYMPMSAPAIFAPFVRLDLLHWDLLFGRPASGFELRPWYQQLYEFSSPQDGSSGAEEDADVVPVLVRNVIAPLVLHLAERVWNPVSRSQTRSMYGVLENLMQVYLQPKDKNLQEALRVVRQRLVEAVSGVAVPRWPGEALLASPRAAAYVARQFRRAIGLLSAVASFSPMLPPGVATQLAVDQILLQQVLPLLRSATNDVSRAVGLAEEVVAALPTSWRGKRLPEGAAPLATFVQDLQRRAHGNNIDPATSQRLGLLCSALG